MSLMTIEQFEEFAIELPELADAVHVEEHDVDVFTSSLNLVELLSASQNGTNQTQFMKRVTCLFKDATHRQLKVYAARTDRTLITIVSDAVEMYLRQHDASFSDPTSDEENQTQFSCTYVCFSLV